MAAEPLHVVVVGGGVAAVEAVLALHALAGERIRVTMVAPEQRFEIRALRTAIPFAQAHTKRHELATIAEHCGAELVHERIASVEPRRHSVRLAGGKALAYDALVLAVGARPRPAFSRALTFSGHDGGDLFGGLLADLEEHWTRSVAFVVPPGVSWSLPIYELALMTAADVRGMGIDDLRLELITPESSPLAIFGPEPSRVVAELLEQADIRFRGDTPVEADHEGRLRAGGELLGLERVVTLPVLDGPNLPGVPFDRNGFIPIGSDCAVTDVEDIYAAGDGVTFPIKQGGIACQMADVIATALAARAGADVAVEPFSPVLRGRLLTGHGSTRLERGLDQRPARDPKPELELWAPDRKVDGRFLSDWLAGASSGAADGPADPQAVEVAIELPAPG